MIDFSWRGRFENEALATLRAEGFGAVDVRDWWSTVNRHSLGWVVAHDQDELVGFVNVGWDGGAHAFLLDTVVSAGRRRTGIARRLVRIAVERARAGGCQWLHVDFEDHLGPFYLEACHFTPTPAGLIALR